jgi:hypothetical protein
LRPHHVVSYSTARRSLHDRQVLLATLGHITALNDRSCAKSVIAARYGLRCATFARSHTRIDGGCCLSRLNVSFYPIVQAFSTSSALTSHMQTHRGPMYECTEPNCGKKFAQSSSLHRHKQLHAGVRPYTCEVGTQSLTARCKNACRPVQLIVTWPSLPNVLIWDTRPTVPGMWQELHPRTASG